MAAIVHSHHSRRSMRRKFARGSFDWARLGRFTGFVCSCCKNHRMCPLLHATPDPLVPGVGIPIGHKAPLTILQEPTHRACPLLLVKLPRKTLKPQWIWIRLQLEARKCFLHSTIADLCSRFGTRQPLLMHPKLTVAPTCIEVGSAIQVDFTMPGVRPYLSPSRSSNSVLARSDGTLSPAQKYRH